MFARWPFGGIWRLFRLTHSEAIGCSDIRYPIVAKLGVVYVWSCDWFIYFWGEKYDNTILNSGSQWQGVISSITSRYWRVHKCLTGSDKKVVWKHPVVNKLVRQTRNDRRVFPHKGDWLTCRIYKESFSEAFSCPTVRLRLKKVNFHQSDRNTSAYWNGGQIPLLSRWNSSWSWSLRCGWTHAYVKMHLPLIWRLKHPILSQQPPLFPDNGRVLEATGNIFRFFCSTLKPVNLQGLR